MDLTLKELLEFAKAGYKPADVKELLELANTTPDEDEKKPDEDEKKPDEDNASDNKNAFEKLI